MDFGWQDGRQRKELRHGLIEFHLTFGPVARNGSDRRQGRFCLPQDQTLDARAIMLTSIAATGDHNVI
jgi:hypothetical protein